MSTTSERPSLGDCPGPDLLQAYASGKLALDTVEAVAGHVATCLTCSDALASLAPEDDFLGEALRDCLTAGADPAAVAAPAGAGGPQATLSENSPTAATETPGGVAGHAPAGHRGPPLTVIGHYRVVERIDRGGMGTVYKATHTRLHTVVAIKTLRQDLCATPEARQRFLTEGRAAARLDHPGVVRVLDFGEQSGEPYLVMEFVPGGSLGARLARGPLPPAEAAALVEQVARAVDYAHGRGVYHRDLKPANVLLAADGAPKVGDFGLARLLDEGARLTQTQAVMGTPAYMAPEQAAGRARLVGPATDVYGLGAVLYEALTGRPPFEGNREQVLRRVREEDPDPPSRCRPEVPARLEAVCLRCLEKRPGARFASAGELADDLGRFVRGERPRTKPRGWLRRRLRAARRHPVSAGLLVLAALGAAAALPVADRLDPDRGVKRIERELAAGKPVELIGEAGGPRWSRWLIQEDPNQAPALQDGVFSVQSWGQGLLELVRDPQLDSYRLRVRVKHIRAGQGCAVGCFIGHRQYATAPAVHQFVSLQFDDITPSPDPPPVRPGMRVTRTDKNLVSLQSHFYAPGAELRARWHVTGQAGCSKRLCKPAATGRTGWRTLLVDVTPGQVRAVWDGDEGNAMRASFAELTDNAATALSAVKPGDPNQLFVSAVRPDFVPRGGVGLYVESGSAAFASVTIEPR